ncbi:MAG TPA: hypothetical protein PLY56_00590 [Armatimonadota bacterium]|nr:hypothetical protein [Armatimonadota bacterium]HOM82527.1 hypothetical protein [Armatimonadota bacterium]HPO72627.1 hypothetical protein [Armatimonadota bacterium]
MGPYCQFCHTRCFVQLPEDTPEGIREAYGPATLIATCHPGQFHERERVGYCYTDILRRTGAAPKTCPVCERAMQAQGNLCLDCSGDDEGDLPEWPLWADAVVEAMNSGLMECWPGGLLFGYVEAEHQVVVRPTPFHCDGDQVAYPSFFLSIEHLVALFDAPPAITMCTREDDVSVEGEIGGEHVWVQIRKEPLDSDEPVGRLHPDGGFEEYGDGDDEDPPSPGDDRA